MNAQKIAFVCLFNRNSIVQVFGFSAVNGENVFAAQILTVIEAVFLNAALRDFSGFTENFIGKFCFCAVNGKYR